MLRAEKFLDGWSVRSDDSTGELAYLRKSEGWTDALVGQVTALLVPVWDRGYAEGHEVGSEEGYQAGQWEAEESA
jgi:hypothetical protein